MAIYTRSGLPAEIISVDFGANETWVSIKRTNPDGAVVGREIALRDLRADNGLAEIMGVIYELYPEHNPHSEFYIDAE